MISFFSTFAYAWNKLQLVTKIQEKVKRNSLRYLKFEFFPRKLSVALWSLVKRKTDIILISRVGKSYKKDLGVKSFGFLRSLKSLVHTEKFKMADPMCADEIFEFYIDFHKTLSRSFWDS